MADENQMDQGSAVSPQARQKASMAGRTRAKAAEDVGSAAGAWDEYRERGKKYWMTHSSRAQFQDEANQYVRENPPKAVLRARSRLVLGFYFPSLEIPIAAADTRLAAPGGSISTVIGLRVVDTILWPWNAEGKTKQQEIPRLLLCSKRCLRLFAGLVDGAR